ncbi:hypothetical protein F5B19DRAFT_465651 [Rostrohypoxylon terebratum]|nr:hypothetical protein F5B19DRAFT_465651 [Rostrohypoxylon terebratum]
MGKDDLFYFTGPLEFMEKFTTTHKPWPKHEGNQFRLQQQGFVERVFFNDGATIDFDKIPSLQWWAPLVGTADNYRINNVVSTLIAVSRSAGRPLSPKEVEVASDYAARSARWQPRGRLWTASAALLCAYYGWDSYRFPFYTPRGAFDPSFFPGRNFALFKGTMAKFAWHSARVQVYMMLCAFGIVPFASSMASMSFQVRLLRDPELQDLQADLKRRLLERANAESNPQLLRTDIPPPLQFQEYPGSENQAPSQFERDTFNGPPESGISWRQSTPPPVSPSNNQGTSFPDPGPRSTDDSDPFGGDDDGSPVPMSVKRTEAQQGRNTQGGSAWDRLRQQSRSAQSANSSTQEGGWAQQRQARNSQETSQKTEDFTYTNKDEEKERRSYGKEQAQNDFDALLEAERRGGSGRR